MKLLVAEDDVLGFYTDVLVLKYAQASYGVDDIVARRLDAIHMLPAAGLPKPQGFRLIESQGCVGAKKILFVGVPELRAFGYEAIRDFSRRALASLAGPAPEVAHVTFTLHGVGYGLDEAEAFRAQLAGILEAVNSGDYPSALQQVTIVERNPGRARRMQDLLRRSIPEGLVDTLAWGSAAKALEPLEDAGVSSETKSYIFVAMPFDPAFDDHFHYGIERSIHAAGFLCERADLSAFTGDVMSWVKERIDNASLVVAVLSSANPNVYLEVGYAWGRGIRTVLLIDDTKFLCFDTRGQRCLPYKSIRELEDALTRELRELGATSD